MTKQIEQNSADAPEGAATMELDEAFKFIGKLAQRAAQGDGSAGLLLQILNAEQLAKIGNLELELAIRNTLAVDRATLQFMALPEETV